VMSMISRVLIADASSHASGNYNVFDGVVVTYMPI
jgi:hypothetical protein